jgi:UDP-N-acetyl-D-glucosamine dehydrogenase
MTDVAIVGAGYVGVPLAQVFTEAGKSVVLFDVQPDLVAQLNRGESHIEDVPSDVLAPLVEQGLRATTDFDELGDADAILVAVPTPLSKQREPDLSYVERAAGDIAKRLRRGQLIVLESTTYPGTTRECVLPILERTGLKVGEDFHLAFSPERVDPGREDWTTKNVPKVIGGITQACTDRAAELYGAALETVHPVSTPEAAELTKLLENIFRSVNIALMNEIAQLCDRMEIDIWEVVDAAATKPFGFMRFEPGPGLGGHCIPIDPFYLSWKARQYELTTRFIELAGEINQAMPAYVVEKLADALNDRGKSLKGARILILGVAYKRDIDDLRESPALTIIEELQRRGADVAYNDPYFPKVGRGRKYNLQMTCAPLEKLGQYDCVLIVTDHSDYDYKKIVQESRLVVDSRNATKGIESEKIVHC